MEEQKADKEYQDGSTSAFGGLLTKTFRPGAAPEYYNPPSSLELNKTNSFNDGKKTKNKHSKLHQEVFIEKSTERIRNRHW